MNETVKDIYMLMLSSNVKYDSQEERKFDARWLLIDLGVPLIGRIVDGAID